MRYADCHRDRKHKGNGLCRNCYQRAWHTANPGRQWQQRNPEEARKYLRDWYQANRERIAAQRKEHRASGKYKARDRRIWLAYRYGMTPEDFRNHLVGQAGRCLICSRVPETDLVPDHDHTTGKVRGLLCQACNKGIGHFADDPKRLRSAARYVERAS